MSDLKRVRYCERRGNRYEYADRAWRCKCGGVLTLPQTESFSGPVGDTGMWRFARNLPVNPVVNALAGTSPSTSWCAHLVQT
jgi:hypothetical protein